MKQGVDAAGILKYILFGMEAESILEALQYNRGVFPRKALEEAIEQKEAMIPRLLGILAAAGEDIRIVLDGEGYFAHIYAAFLLAQFRVKEACPLIVNLLKHPGEVLEQVWGDALTESLPNILASVCGGDAGLIRELIEDPKRDEYVRAAALQSLLVLVAAREMPRQDVVEYFHTLFTGRLEREPSFVWTRLASCCYHIHPGEMNEEVDRAFADGLAETFFVSLEDMQSNAGRSVEQVMAELRKNSSFQLIDDTIAELQDWACFESSREKEPEVPHPSAKQLKKALQAIKRAWWEEPVETVRNPPKIGRNDPCPCGSGKKYKRCCGR